MLIYLKKLDVNFVSALKYINIKFGIHQSFAETYDIEFLA